MWHTNLKKQVGFGFFVISYRLFFIIHTTREKKKKEYEEMPLRKIFLPLHPEKSEVSC